MKPKPKLMKQYLLKPGMGAERRAKELGKDLLRILKVLEKVKQTIRNGSAARLTGVR